MPELRDVLREGADVPTGLPDMPAVWSRAVRERRRRRLAAGAVVAAVVGVVAVLGSVLLPGQSPPPQPAITPQLAPASPLPSYPGPLLGRQTYETGAAGLSYAFTTPGPGWTMAAREPGWVSLHRGTARVNLQQWDGVYDPGAEADPAVDEVPTDLPGWIASHPRLRVEDGPTVTLGDDRWRVLDVSVRAPLATSPPECAGTPCVLLAQVGAEAVELLASERAALYLPVDSSDTTVVLVASPASSTAAWNAATTLVNTLQERPIP